MPVRSPRRGFGNAALAAAVIAVLCADAQAQSVQVQALLDRGDRAFARGDYESAGKLYDRAIVAEPRTVDASYYAKRADIFVFQKEYALGLRWIAATAEVNKPRDPLILAKKALLLESSGRHAQAIALAERVVARAPRDYSLQLLVGTHHFARRAKGADRAIAAYTAFLASRPAQLQKADLGIRLRLGYAYMYKGDFAGARRQLAAVQRSASGDKSPAMSRLARSGLCAALTGMESWRQAVTACQAALGPSQTTTTTEGSAGSSAGALHYNLARAHLKLEQPARALAAANKYLQLRPRAPRGYLLRGDIRAAAGDWQRAEAEYREAARVAPGNPDAALRLGRLHLRQQRPRPELALAELKVAHKAYPDAVDIVSDLGAAHLANRQYAEARELAQASLDKVGTRGPAGARATLLVVVGDAHYMEGESLDEAAAAYERALAAAPDHAGARAGLLNSLNRVAMAELEKGDAQAAQDALERAVEIDSKSAMSQFNLGLVLVERGKPRAALEPLTAAHQLAPAEARVELVLARALSKSGDADKAIEHLRKARSTALREGAKPLAAECSVELGPLLIDAGKLDEAVDVLEQGVSLGGGAAEDQARINLQLAYLRRGIARLRVEQDSDALADLTRATERLSGLNRTESAVARFALALAHVHTGRAGKGAGLLAQLDREAGRRPVAWLQAPYDRQGLDLFVAYAAYGEGTVDSLDRAADSFDKLSSRVRPSLGRRVRELLRGTYERLAWQAYRIGKRKLARKALEKARNAGAGGGDAVTIHNLAVIKGGPDARRIFARLGNEPPEALLNLGILEEAAGDSKAAYELWKAARAAGVKFRELDTWLARKRTYFGYK